MPFRYSIMIYLALCIASLLTPLNAIDAFSANCHRTPPGTTTRKTHGDGGFTIHISGNPEKYVPGEVYTVGIKGKRSQYSVQKFTSFMLIVESSSPSAYIYGAQSVGTFQLYGDVLTRHSEDCPNAVVQTSNIVKGEIQVLWTAPPAGSGCVRFKATVSEHLDIWYMDDGELKKVLCEELQDNEDTQPQVISECCACDEAKYEVTFEGLWSRQTHPKDFPANEWLTHFSDIIGASHSNHYRLWEYGGLASDGLRQVAEWGSTRAIESELKRQSNHIRTIIKARGLWFPDVNKKTFAVLRVDNKHHLMSLVSMLGPSPDWVVGVSALELCTSDCNWVGNKTLKLYPWDSGTDAGITYMSSNAPSIPRDKIRRITNSYPNDAKNPFYDPKGLPMKPLAKLTISRQRVYKKSCSDGLFPSDFDEHTLDSFDGSEDRPECAVTEWSGFSECSVTCGKGLRMRTRYYRDGMKANIMQCTVQLQQNEMCPGRVPFCANGNENQFFAKIEDPLCGTSDWTPWNPCSVTCGLGVKMRYRRFKNRLARKRCDKELNEKKTCMADIKTCPVEFLQPENSACKVTEWTDWSPCSATCGKGFRVRTRFFLVPAEEQDSCTVTTRDKQICSGELLSCRIDASVAKEVCLLEKNAGPCRGYFPRWYYDSERRVCVQFIYGGCRGNRNNFEAYDECTKICEFSRDELHEDLISLHSNDLEERYSFANSHAQPFHDLLQPNNYSTQSANGLNFLQTENHLGPKIDCQYSNWSSWSECSVSCGRGWRERRRRIKVESKNGGKPCSRKTIRRRKCKSKKCEATYNKNIANLESLSLVYEPYEHYSSPILPPANLQFSKELVSETKDYDEFVSPENVYGRKENCEMGNWSPWSPCTHSCGSESMQQRARSIIVKPVGEGIPCGPRLQRRYCTLPPCPEPKKW